MRSYELTYIVKPDVDTANLAVLLDKVKGFITTEGGSVLKVDQWGMRRLAYPIRKFRDGQYVFTLIEIDGASLARIESRLRLTEDILRYLLVRADEIAPAESESADILGGAETLPSSEAALGAETAAPLTATAPAEEAVAVT